MKQFYDDLVKAERWLKRHLNHPKVESTLIQVRSVLDQLEEAQLLELALRGIIFDSNLMVPRINPEALYGAKRGLMTLAQEHAPYPDTLNMTTVAILKQEIEHRGCQPQVLSRGDLSPVS